MCRNSTSGLIKQYSSGQVGFHARTSPESENRGRDGRGFYGNDRFAVAKAGRSDVY
jgi:hypothetical protein